jgi:hypothetical protein
VTEKGESLRRIDTDYEMDPEVPEYLDPESEEEVFRILQQLGTRPEDLIESAGEYATWLERRRK